MTEILGQIPVLIPGLILAGGLARRMGGGDKSLLLLGGKSVLTHVIERLAPQVGPIALNANGDPARFASYGLPVLGDPLPDYPGPLAGVLAGLNWAADMGATHIVTVAADTPFFPTDLVTRLQKAAAEQGVGLALAGTPDPKRGIARQPTFGLWPVALRHDLHDALLDGLRKIVLWTDQHNAATAVFEIDQIDPFFNLNTPEDMLAAQDMIGARAGTGA
jgi:molybdopterin-guanine dinucleotide biosynthesis protein A